MQELISTLNRRKKITILLVILFALIAFIISLNFQITSPTYFDGVYNREVVLFLIVYKLIELPIVYYILFHRYLLRLQNNTFDKQVFKKFTKHSKLLFFLIIQGNTIFGIIAYKFSGDIVYFLIFTLIALITLILIRPDILKTYNNLKT